MRRWFLSYHSPDQALADRLKAAIERKDDSASRVFFAPTHLRASSHSRPRHKHVELRSRYRREFVAWPAQVSFFLARLSFAPPPCRMPLGQSQCIPQADPGGMATPRFWHRLIGFRHVISGSLALASLNHTCRNLVPTFPQRSPPSLLTTAACGGLRSTPDCRPRRAFLHLSYSYAPPCGPALLVTQCQLPTHALQQKPLIMFQRHL